jgi:small subunit ribosomal protein S27Ae
MIVHYIIKNGRVVRTNPFCPRCGEGVFMADKGEWWSCGKCGDRYHKIYFKNQLARQSSVSSLSKNT